jgi:NAD(P)-dependent dehydrogenase (short-subunit alcohol dehydrogenase family)
VVTSPLGPSPSPPTYTGPAAGSVFHSAADMGSVLDVVPTLARTGIARLLFDPKDGEPAAQARQFARDVEQMPAQLDRAAQLKTLGDRPLAVVTASQGSQPGWTEHQNQLAGLSSRSFHRTIAGSTHQSLVDDPQHAAASSRAIRDVVVREDVERVVSQGEENFGSLDIVVNNSGATWGAPPAEMPLERFDQVLRVNVRGTFLMSQAAGRRMIERGVLRQRVQNREPLLIQINLSLQHPQIALVLGVVAHTVQVYTATRRSFGFHGIAIGSTVPCRPLRFPRYSAVHPIGSVSRQGLLTKADALSK